MLGTALPTVTDDHDRWPTAVSMTVTNYRDCDCASLMSVTNCHDLLPKTDYRW